MEIISRILQKKLQTSFEDLWEARQERHTFNDIDALKNISLKWGGIKKGGSKRKKRNFRKRRKGIGGGGGGGRVG